MLELTLTERGALVVQQEGQNILSDVAFALGVENLECLHHIAEGVRLEAVNLVRVFGHQVLEHELFELVETDLTGEREACQIVTADFFFDQVLHVRLVRELVKVSHQVRELFLVNDLLLLNIDDVPALLDDLPVVLPLDVLLVFRRCLR